MHISLSFPLPHSLPPFCLYSRQDIRSMLISRPEAGGHRPAVPNLLVETPRGVAIDFHWGRHWSSDIKKIHAQLHTHNVRSCLCKNCALSKFIIYILYSSIYRQQYHRSCTFCMCCIFCCISIIGVAVLREIFFGVARCRRLGITDIDDGACHAW